VCCHSWSPHFLFDGVQFDPAYGLEVVAPVAQDFLAVFLDVPAVRKMMEKQPRKPHGQSLQKDIGEKKLRVHSHDWEAEKAMSLGLLASSA